MALISCPECGKEISDKAFACPHCGNPMNPQPQQVQQPQQEEYLCCPKCGSRELHAEHKGFSGGKALIGAVAVGGLGLLAGTLGSRDTQITCLKCGKKFKAGEARVVRNPSSVSISASQTATPTKHICGICGYIYEGGVVPAKCPICKAPAEKFQPLYENATNEASVSTSEVAMKKQFTCGVCGYIYDGDTAPEKCPICKASASHFDMQEVPDKSRNGALNPTANTSGNGCSIIVLIGISLTLGALALI